MEHAEQVRQMVERLDRGDVEGMLAFVSEDFVTDYSRALGPFQGVYHGREVAGLWSSFAEVWDDFHWELQRITEVDADNLVAVVRIRGHGRGSGLEVDATGAFLWQFAGGRPVRATLYQTEADALEAARGEVP
jgi:ketosteroid isomerase-like protein